MKCVKIFFLILGLFAFQQMGWAQQNEVGLTFTPSKTEAKNGDFISTSLKIVNHTGKNFKGKLLLSSNAILRVIGDRAHALNLKQNDSLFVSVRMLVSRKAKAGVKYRTRALLLNAAGDGLAHEDFQVSIKAFKKMQLFVQDQQILIQKRGGFYEIPVRLHNAGNTAQKIALLTKLPSELNEDYQNKLFFVVDAFQDTVVTIRQKISRKMMSLDHFTVDITGVYAGENPFAWKAVEVSAVKTERKFRDYAGLPLRDNMLLVRIRNIGDENAVYESRLRSKVQLSEDETVQLNANAFWRQTIDEYYLRDTWIGYRNKRYGGRIGTIYKNFAVSLYGRGGEFTLNDKSGNNEFQIGVLDKAYRLFNTSPYVDGKSFWLTFKSNHDKKKLSGTLIYDTDNFKNYKKALAGVQGDILSKSRIKLSGGLFAGTSSTYRFESQWNYGLAGKLNLRARAGKFSFISNNFVSSDYFPGRRRGAFSLNEQVSWAQKKYRFYTSFNHYSYRPKYLVLSQGIENELGLTRFRVGAIRRVGKVNISLAPEYSYQFRHLNYRGASGLNAALASRHLNVGLNYFGFDYSLTMNAKVGFAHVNWLSKDYFQTKFRLNYNWGILNVNAMYQHGPFYLGEVIANQNSIEDYKRWRINPAVRYALLNERLELEAGVSFAYGTRTGNSVMMTGGINYATASGFEFFTGLDYYKYNLLDYTNRYVEFGVIKHFATPKLDSNKYDLKLFVYREKNGDHTYTPGEDEIAAGQLVYINKKAFRTNKKGYLEYNNIPIDTYTIHFDQISIWHARDFSIGVNEDTKISIGLDRMTTVRGSVKYQSNILSYSIHKQQAGLLIRAMDKTGRTYSTKTNADGNYYLYVPKGRYTVSLTAGGISNLIIVSNNYQIIKTLPKDPVQVNFDIKIKERSVEYKQFKSSNN